MNILRKYDSSHHSLMHANAFDTPLNRYRAALKG